MNIPNVVLVLFFSTPYVEGSCVTDPCWYAVPNATGKEVVIFDVSPGTDQNLLAKHIIAKTETGAPVAAMCNSSAVSHRSVFAKPYHGA
jgi:hypothetical protein